jgi:hypothetical protein
LAVLQGPGEKNKKKVKKIFPGPQKLKNASSKNRADYHDAETTALGPAPKADFGFYRYNKNARKN